MSRRGVVLLELGREFEESEVCSYEHYNEW